jgi:hypothetical protein
MNTVSTSSQTGPGFARPGRLNRDEHKAAGDHQRAGLPARYAAWLLYAFAAVALLVTIAVTARPGPVTCAGAGRISAAGHHAQIQTCAPAKNPPVLGSR